MVVMSIEPVVTGLHKARIRIAATTIVAVDTGTGDNLPGYKFAVDTKCNLGYSIELTRGAFGSTVGKACRSAIDVALWRPITSFDVIRTRVNRRKSADRAREAARQRFEGVTWNAVIDRSKGY